MSERTRNFLWLYGITLAITLAAVAIACLIFLSFNGNIQPPAATVNNFWSLINTFLLPALVGFVVFKIEQHKRQSQQNSQKLDRAIETVAQIKHVVENGGGEGTKQLQSKVDRLLERGEARDPDSRSRATDQQEAGGVYPDQPTSGGVGAAS